MEPSAAMGHKDDEFIDHTLLPPEYMREPTHFIMDLMESPVGFPKNVTSNTVPQPHVNGFAGKDTLNSELNFQNTIFNFINKHGGEPVATSSAQHQSLSIQSVMSLNGHLYDAPDAVKAANHKVINQPPPVPSFPNLQLEQTVTLHDGDIVYNRSNARKVLPHKKRISRKLKAGQNMPLQPPSEPLAPAPTPFSCELCGHAATTQISFFAHLKQHYEPQPPDTVLAAMRTTIDALEPAKNCADLCAINKKTEDTNIDNVLNDVHLHFDNFSNVGDQNPDDDMKILTSHGIDKCMGFVTQTAVPALRQILVDPDEVEFSDTEDMLEGIRNVVDKVSIEDTCDDIDFMAAHGIRAPWFVSGFNEVNNIPLGEMAVAPPVDQSDLKKDEVLDLDAPLGFANNGSAIVDFETGEEFIHENMATKLRPEVSLSVVGSVNGSGSRRGSVSDGEEDEGEELVPPLSPSAVIPQFYCFKCKREFNSNNALKYHRITHLGKRSFQCNICQKSFFAKGALKSHELTHTGDKPYECDHCHRKFRQWGDLKYHVVSIHTKEKHYQCEFCGKSFARKYSLVVHRRIHTSERNYKCEFCEKTFRASSYLQNHRRIHTGDKPHECAICGKKFRVSGDLRRHLRIHESKKSRKVKEGKDRKN